MPVGTYCIKHFSFAHIAFRRVFAYAVARMTQAIKTVHYVKPSIIFDTSALNQLLDDPESDCLAAGLKAGLPVHITGVNVLEIAATTNPRRRNALLRFCLWLADDFIRPWNEVVKMLVAAHKQNQTSFDWRILDVKWHAARENLLRIEITDEIAETQRSEANELNRTFLSMFSEGKRFFEDLFSRQPGERFHDFHELVDVAEKSAGGIWKIGKAIYKTPTDENTIRVLYNVCPPFKALLLAVCAASYEHWIRELKTAGSLRGGAVDLFSAVYLPYCSKMVTSDDRQLNALRLVAVESNLASLEIISYNEFRKAFSLAVG